MCSVVAQGLLPHVNKCLRLMYPLQQISLITGVPVTQLQREVTIFPIWFSVLFCFEELACFYYSEIWKDTVSSYIWGTWSYAVLCKRKKSAKFQCISKLHICPAFPPVQDFLQQSLIHKLKFCLIESNFLPHQRLVVHKWGEVIQKYGEYNPYGHPG